MIKTSGYRVSPTEIEEAAYETGLVRDAVAVGVPDDRLGQRIVLVATGTSPGGLDVEAVTQAFRQSLPLYMVPAEILEWEEIPRSPNGKFDRPLIRDKVTP
jgi:acyl-CoA synthetase (AMP-forming)/AMP-acid ligase II